MIRKFAQGRGEGDFCLSTCALTVTSSAERGGVQLGSKQLVPIMIVGGMKRMDRY